MRNRPLFLLCAVGLAIAASGGCVVSLHDAVSAGIFDYISGAVTSALQTIIGTPGG